MLCFILCVMLCVLFCFISCVSKNEVKAAIDDHHKKELLAEMKKLKKFGELVDNETGKVHVVVQHS